MALTAPDAWNQHVAGPALLWLLAGAPAGFVIYVLSGVLDYNIHSHGPWIEFYSFVTLLSICIVAGTFAYSRYGGTNEAE